MIRAADQFGPWRDGINPAERPARLPSDADARCSCFSGLPHPRTLSQSRCNGGRGCVDSCGSVIPVITAVISVSIEGRIVIIWKSAVNPLIKNHHGRVKIGREITAFAKICSQHSSILCGSISQLRDAEEYFERLQKTHGVHQLKLRDGRN